MKILVALDNSPSSQAALEALEYIICPAPSTIKLVTVVEHAEHHARLLNSHLADRAWLTVHADSGVSHHLQQLAHDVLRRMPHVQVDCHVLGGAIGSALIWFMHDWQPDLVILGAHLRRSIWKKIFGGVTGQVLKSSSCPVLVARRDKSGHAFSGTGNNILVPIDRTPQSVSALDWLLQHQIAGPSKIALLYVIPPEHNRLQDHNIHSGEPRGQRRIFSLEESKNAALGIMTPWKDKLEEKWGVGTVGIDIVCGLPNQVILAAARRWPAHLVVLGAQKHSWLVKALQGNISEDLLWQCDCSVEIVPYVKSASK